LAREWALVRALGLEVPSVRVLVRPLAQAPVGLSALAPGLEVPSVRVLVRPLARAPVGLSVRVRPLAQAPVLEVHLVQAPGERFEPVVRLAQAPGVHLAQVLEAGLAPAPAQDLLARRAAQAFPRALSRRRVGALDSDRPLVRALALLLVRLRGLGLLRHQHPQRSTPACFVRARILPR
jgi:hypothetical protein